VFSPWRFDLSRFDGQILQIVSHSNLSQWVGLLGCGVIFVIFVEMVSDVRSGNRHARIAGTQFRCIDPRHTTID
jgi:hypothetical protein